MTPPSSRYDPDVHFDVETIDTRYRDDLAAGGSVRLERFEGVPHLFAAKSGPDTDRAVALMKAFVSEQMTAVASV